MKNTNKLTNQLHDAIGGEWKTTQADAPLQGFTANFPKFRSDAIVGVVNAAAEQVGAKERAVSFSTGDASDALGHNPQAPRDVVIPKVLAENRAFQELLTDDMRQDITSNVSRQLSYAASQGMHSR